MEINKILDNIRDREHLKNDTELSSLFGVRQPAVSNWRTREKESAAALKKIIKYCDKNNIPFSEIFHEKIEEKTVKQPGTDPANIKSVMTNGLALQESQTTVARMKMKLEAYEQFVRSKKLQEDFDHFYFKIIKEDDERRGI